jgi:hypothetical protein
MLLNTLYECPDLEQVLPECPQLEPFVPFVSQMTLRHTQKYCDSKLALQLYQRSSHTPSISGARLTDRKTSHRSSVGVRAPYMKQHPPSANFTASRRSHQVRSRNPGDAPPQTARTLGDNTTSRTKIDRIMKMYTADFDADAPMLGEELAFSFKK